MPWEVPTMSEQRIAFVHCVIHLHHRVSDACQSFGISRKTGYKWLKRYRQNPHQPLDDQHKRPRICPHQTDPQCERRIMAVRDEFGWGARKIHAFLTQRDIDMPSIATINQVLKRHQRLVPQPHATPPPIQRFERHAPNELWQLDFKGPIEVQRRRRHPLTIIDDHSRYLLRLVLRDDHTMAGVFEVLWDTFADVGMPQSILCDNEFATTFRNPRTVSWFDSCLLRLNINPVHGRPYHPQTQGKVERLHRTFEDELYPRVRRDSVEHFHQDAQRWRHVYNTLRPHESLDDQPPAARWRASPRKRPNRLPEPVYPDHLSLRKVAATGDVRWRRCRILAGRGLAGQFVGIHETQQGVAVYYCHKRVRLIPHELLIPGCML